MRSRRWMNPGVHFSESTHVRLTLSARLGDDLPGTLQRNSPPPGLLGVLAEAAIVCRRRELPNLYSHYDSRAIALIAVLQSWSQGVEVRGAAGMKKLWSASNVFSTSLASHLRKGRAVVLDSENRPTLIRTQSWMTGPHAELPEPTLYFGSADEFLREYLHNVYLRRIDGKSRIWAAGWWEYHEGVIRLELSGVPGNIPDPLLIY